LASAGVLSDFYDLRRIGLIYGIRIIR